MMDLPDSPLSPTTSNMRSRQAPCRVIRACTSSFALARRVGSFASSKARTILSIDSIWLSTSFCFGIHAFPIAKTHGAVSTERCAPYSPPGDHAEVVFLGGSSPLRLQAKHRRMVGLQRFSIAEIHVHSTRQTRIETAHRPHDVDTLELVGTVILEDRCVLHGVFIGSGRSVDITRVCVPRCRWIRMVVGNFAVANDHVMRKHAADGFVETASDGVLWNFEVRTGFRAALMHFRQCLFCKIQSSAGGVNLEVGARAITLNGVTPLA